MFKKTPIDTFDMVQKIKTLSDYKSIKEIIKKQEEAPDQKLIFKVQSLPSAQESSNLQTPKLVGIDETT